MVGKPRGETGLVVVQQIDDNVPSGKQLGVGTTPSTVIHASGANPILRVDSEGAAASAQDSTLMLRSLQDGWGEVKFHPSANGALRWMSFGANNNTGGQLFLTQPGQLGLGCTHV